MFITHAVACYVAIDLAWNNYILQRISHERNLLLWEYVVRTIIVLLTCKYIRNIDYLFISVYNFQIELFLNYF